MKKIICTASLHAVGCTFVDWSIHFLSGQSIFYSVNTQTWRPLVANPVSKTNAHGHNKNHPSGLDSIKQCVTDFQNNNTGQLFSFYPYPMHADIACRQLGLEPPKQLDSVLTEKIQTKRKQDWIDAIDYCLEQNLKVIYIELDKQDLLYTISPRNIGRMFFDPSWADSAEQARAHVDNLFFANDYKAWQQQGLVNIWDRREFLALCRRPFNDSYQDWKPDIARPHLWIGSRSLWHNGQHTIKKIMEFCELAVDATRWESWLAVYNKWQKLHLEILEFTFNYQHIVDAIVNDWYYELNDLSFEQEIVIQHCLIYQHGLNLKTWGLEKFPANTKELHQLLEPNIHKIDSIY